MSLNAVGRCGNCAFRSDYLTACRALYGIGVCPDCARRVATRIASWPRVVVAK